MLLKRFDESVQGEFFLDQMATVIAHASASIHGDCRPVVVPLPPTTSSSGTGCTTGVSRSLAIAIIQRPWEYYVNVHNAEFPTGAARGQLSRTP